MGKDVKSRMEEGSRPRLPAVPEPDQSPEGSHPPGLGVRSPGGLARSYSLFLNPPMKDSPMRRAASVMESTMFLAPSE